MGEISVHHFFLIDVLLVAGVAVLVFSACHDVAVRTVPNAASAALIGLGIAIRLIGGPVSVLGWSAGIAAFVLGVTFIFWRLGWMGGGDVKLLTAASFFLPPTLQAQAHLIGGTALAGGLLAVLYLLASAVVQRPPAAARPRAFLPRILRCEQWRLSRRGPLPYATAIAVGGVIATLHV
jgi:prepilin peptidase CpaA